MNIEKISHSLALENKKLIFAGVTADPDFENYTVYAAFEDGCICGILVMDQRGQEPEILSLGIGRDYEGRGIATDLLRFGTDDYLDEMKKGSGSDRFFASLTVNEMYEKAVIRVFEKVGFSLLEMGTNYEGRVVDVAANRKLAAVLKKGNPGKLTPAFIEDVDGEPLTAFIKRLEGREPFTIEDLGGADRKMSIAGIANGKIAACALFAEEKSGTIFNKYTYHDTSGCSAKDLNYLFALALKKISEEYSGDTKICFIAADEKMENLIYTFLPDAKKSDRFLVFERDFEY